MAQHNQTKNQETTIFDASVSIDPVAVVYNIENDTIENFLYNYLHDVKKIDGVHATRVHVTRDGNRNPELAFFVFFTESSKDIFTQTSNIPKHLRRKMDMGGFKASPALFEALKPMMSGEFKLAYNNQQRLVYVRLDVFKVLGLLLAAHPRRHYLTVTEVKKLKKGRSIATVIKSNNFVDKSESFDKFESIMANAVRHR